MTNLNLKPNSNSYLEFLVDKYSGQLPNLSQSQVLQICHQIIEHDYQSKELSIELCNKEISLICYRDVLQPMSSRYLAHFVSKRRDIFQGSLVYDIVPGTASQAIAATLSGARKLIASDIYDAPVANACANIEKLGLSSIIKVSQADLFDEKVHQEKADAIIFAHPYFGDRPILDFPVTTGMLDPGVLVPQFLKYAKDFLKPGGSILSIHWPFAGQINDPRTYLDQHPEYSIVEIEKRRASFVQQGDISIMRIALI
jgi:methylase of polypeptide subunit release factors